MKSLVVSMLMAGCVIESPLSTDDGEPAEPGAEVEPELEPEPAPTPIADERCEGVPPAGPARSWRHYSSRLVVELGAPHHRGIDLIATDTDATQIVSGKITYGPTDKDLEDEDIDLFACISGAWQPLATARTDGDGKFALSLSGAARLPVGLRDMYLSVAGDRSGARFVALVAPATAHVVVSDVDGTLTSHENAYPEYLALGSSVVPHAGAPDALASLAARGYVIVYVTARGDRFTQDTRDWFEANGFPRGPLRMPTAIITLPGEETIEFKTQALASVAGLSLAAGIGNRATDIAAYVNAGLSAERIFIKLAEYADEVTEPLASGQATGFASYRELAESALAAMP